MLFWSPFLLGILAGVIFIILSIYLRKKSFPKLVTVIPTFVLLAGGIIMISVGYIYFYGFEGFAYFQFGVANLLCLLLLFPIITNKTSY
ncbi:MULTISPECIES: hypothetical protein [unclassified Solibacillus]|uniref:hypothetical protein n=1 Tax=unclassified Solibacillus TaxID=2637870 RepID=UPI0030D34CAC